MLSFDDSAAGQDEPAGRVPVLGMELDGHRDEDGLHQQQVQAQGEGGKR